MGRGGELCFFGSPQTALDFFGVGNYDDIYTALERTSPAVWRSRYEQTTVRMTAVRGANARALGPEPAAAAERGRTGPQARILAHRYARIFLRDRRNIAILLGQVPLLALGMVGLFKADLFSRATGQPGNGAQLLFL